MLSGCLDRRATRTLSLILMLLAATFGQRVLADTPPAGRPAEPLQIRNGTTLKECPDWVAALAIAPDGQTAAAGTYESFSLLSLATEKELVSLPEKAGFVKSLAFSADGKTLAVGSYQTVALWDVVSKKKLQALPGHQGYVLSLVFSKDGKWLVTGCDDETVRIWETSGWKLKQTLAGHSKPVTGVAISPDGLLIASCSGDETKPSKAGEVKLWELASGKELSFSAGTATGVHDKGVNAVAFSPDGKRLASSSFDETIKIWEIPGGKLERTLEGHSRPVNSVAFFADGKLLATSGGGRFIGGNEIRVWDVATGDVKAILKGHEARVLQAVVTPDSKRLLSGSGDTTVRVWDLSPLISAKAAPKAIAAVDSPQPKPAAVVDAKKADDKPAVATPAPVSATKPARKVFRAGMIGLDTSHAVAFAQILNAVKPPEDIAGCRIVAAYPKGSPDILSSTRRVPEYTKTLEKLGVEIVDSIDVMLTKVDVVFLETNDGRPHLEQVLPVLKAGKPVFIDKPIAGSLTDAIAIFDAAKKYKVPIFSSSSLRFTKRLQEIRNGKYGAIYGCDAYSPCHLEATHPDFFWYGVHGVEMLYTVMCTGCEKVSRVSTKDIDMAVGVWKGGRVGSFRGLRHAKAGYGGTVFTAQGVQPLGDYESYRVLVVEIIKFFGSGKPPVTEAETLELFAFMEAADESKRQGGAPVALAPLMEKARKEAAARLAKLDKSP